MEKGWKLVFKSCFKNKFLLDKHYFQTKTSWKNTVLKTRTLINFIEVLVLSWKLFYRNKSVKCMPDDWNLVIYIGVNVCFYYKSVLKFETER